MLFGFVVSYTVYYTIITNPNNSMSTYTGLVLAIHLIIVTTDLYTY